MKLDMQLLVTDRLHMMQSQRSVESIMMPRHWYWWYRWSRRLHDVICSICRFAAMRSLHIWTLEDITTLGSSPRSVYWTQFLAAQIKRIVSGVLTLEFLHLIRSLSCLCQRLETPRNELKINTITNDMLLSYRSI